MTKNRAAKQATRADMQATGATYMQARRAAHVAVEAWETEDCVVIYNTHDPAAAQVVFERYLRMCGFKPGSEEWDPAFDTAAYYEDMQRLWTLPKGDEEPFDHFKEPGPGRVPYMFTGL